MKKFRSRLAIILAMMMVLTSFTFIGVFADDEDGSDESPVVTKQAQGAETPAEALRGGGESGGEDPAVTVGDVVLDNAYAGCDYVHFMWAPVEDADGYEIKVNNGDWAPYSDDNNVVAKRNGKLHYRVYAPAGASGAEAGTPATLSVRAFVLNGEGVKEYSAESKKTGYPVRTIAYRITIKKGGTLKSHGGPPATMKVSKGQVINAYGFGGGKYIFKNENGSIFYCNKSRTRKRSCVYTRDRYTDIDATFFVNDASTQGRVSSSNGRLVWVNTYTQMLYLFSGTNGDWTIMSAGAEKCATGKAATPSPTGVWGKKTIWKKIKKRHGIKWWSPYSDINSIHSKKAKWKIGAPTSNGCIRNYEWMAYQVYTQAPIGTPVLSY